MYVCTQVVFTCPTREAAQQLQWSSYVWRRGTVPIWWFVELRSGGVGEATINVNARNPYKGTRRSLPFCSLLALSVLIPLLILLDVELG